MQAPFGVNDPNFYFAETYDNEAWKIPLVDCQPDPELDPLRIFGEHFKQIPPSVLNNLDSSINDFSKCILQINNEYFSNGCQGLAKCYVVEADRLVVWREEIRIMFGTVEQHERMIDDIFTTFQNDVPAEEILKRREQISLNKKRIANIYTMLCFLIRLRSIGQK